MHVLDARHLPRQADLCRVRGYPVAMFRSAQRVTGTASELLQSALAPCFGNTRTRLQQRRQVGIHDRGIIDTRQIRWCLEA